MTAFKPLGENGEGTMRTHTGDASNGKTTPRVSAIKTVVAAFGMTPLAMLLVPTTALADVKLGGTTVHGYTPDEMVSVGNSANSTEKLQQLPSDIERIVILIIRYMLPLMAIGAVCVIVYNAIANMFFRAEPDDNSDPTRKKKVPMRKVVKDIFVGFFFVLFSWIIVELILYFIIGGETMISTYLS